MFQKEKYYIYKIPIENFVYNNSYNINLRETLDKVSDEIGNYCPETTYGVLVNISFTFYLIFSEEVPIFFFRSFRPLKLDLITSGIIPEKFSCLHIGKIRSYRKVGNTSDKFIEGRLGFFSDQIEILNDDKDRK